MLISALNKRYGDGCVTFINGDGYVEDVQEASGKTCRLTEDRRQAAKRFNRGDVRFLVSTEAAGEGIDLQESCSALIHVDLPWNPMRLHQRVGRLSRYGQTKPVDVVTVRNPHNVESRIWDLLDQKLARIGLAFWGAMDDPEDIRQLVIGMASPGMFNKVFSEADAAAGRGQRLDDWFNAETATFGSAEAVDTVRDLVGNVARFDFGTVADQIPRVDLPDLVPFVKSILTVRGRRPDQADDLRLSFRPPEEWRDDFVISTVDRYELLFAREPQPKQGEDVAGVGLRVVDRALQDARELSVAYAVIRNLDAPLFVFRVRDLITGSDGPIRAVVVAAQRAADGNWNLMRDWELVHLLNRLADKPRSMVFSDAEPALDTSDILASAQDYVTSQTDALDLPFTLPTVESLACLLPSDPRPIR
ncbi:MAG: SWF/SNF helicase family protein [Acidimicrobiia bacterium]|nr:SWF/SNF helicase family protein [Acidimicrobiia bacterium]